MASNLDTNTYQFCLLWNSHQIKQKTYRARRGEKSGWPTSLVVTEAFCGDRVRARVCVCAYARALCTGRPSIYFPLRKINSRTTLRRIKQRHNWMTATSLGLHKIDSVTLSHCVRYTRTPSHYLCTKKKTTKSCVHLKTVKNHAYSVHTAQEQKKKLNGLTDLWGCERCLMYTTRS